MPLHVPTRLFYQTYSAFTMRSEDKVVNKTWLCFHDVYTPTRNAVTKAKDHREEGSPG